MAIEQYFEEAVAQNDFNKDDTSFLKKWGSVSGAVTDSDDNLSGGFECNICLESVQEPVVTLCGHLYCWPCIYKWLHFQGSSAEDQEQNQQRCPVCKAEVSHTTLVPLYARGQTTKPSKGKAPHLGIVIPRRPLGPPCGVGTPRSPGTANSPRFLSQQLNRSFPSHQRLYHSQRDSYPSAMLSPSGTTTNVFDPVIGMFGEMVYARVFGNSMTNMYSYPSPYHLAGSSSPRFRRHIMQADKSLDRICFFLFCCLILCLLLF
ncbi:zf-C3HC4_2 domain-containing protein [Cephalotus follicularis]|uniref:E3 ubiquitin-protein ligase RMA n=1 Tax=Cephalotus follicularis TaxID=3775 RepID=A0A1Q3BR73_CEPFO|nr:zf-C3HC4_2 domain-containing protein [Cephalotus follicularis]